MVGDFTCKLSEEELAYYQNAFILLERVRVEDYIPKDRVRLYGLSLPLKDNIEFEQGEFLSKYYPYYNEILINNKAPRISVVQDIRKRVFFSLNELKRLQLSGKTYIPPCYKNKGILKHEKTYLYSPKTVSFDEVIYVTPITPTKARFSSSEEEIIDPVDNYDNDSLDEDDTFNPYLPANSSVSQGIDPCTSTPKTYNPEINGECSYGTPKRKRVNGKVYSSVKSKRTKFDVNSVPSTRSSSSETSNDKRSSSSDVPNGENSVVKCNFDTGEIRKPKSSCKIESHSDYNEFSSSVKDTVSIQETIVANGAIEKSPDKSAKLDKKPHPETKQDSPRKFVPRILSKTTKLSKKLDFSQTEEIPKKKDCLQINKISPKPAPTENNNSEKMISEEKHDIMTQPEDPATDPLEVIYLPKRKRGRPKKINPDPPFNPFATKKRPYIIAKKIIQSQVVTVDNGVPKRKRGRPRKKIEFGFQSIVSDIKKIELPSDLWSAHVSVTSKRSQVCFTRLVQLVSDSAPVEVDRSVKFNGGINYFVKINNRSVELVAAPKSVDSLRDIEILLQIVNDININDIVLRYLTR